MAEELIYHLLEPVALLTLELLGKKAALGRVFNENEFRKIRNQCIAHILVSAGRHSLNREVRELMETTGFRPSMWHRLRAVSTLQFFTQHLCRELGLRSLHYTERSQAFRLTTKPLPPICLCVALAGNSLCQLQVFFSH